MSDQPRWLCSSRGVILGPYSPLEIGPWLRGIQTMREVHGVAEPLVVRSDTREQAQAKLRAK